jgi:hypothetical protein
MTTERKIRMLAERGAPSDIAMLRDIALALLRYKRADYLSDKPQASPAKE